MATNTQKKRNLKYLNRDFESFKRDFVEHLRIYFPDTVQDFNDSSVGMMFTELAAFVGDNLSFYLDKRFNESFIDTAIETKSVYKHAKQLGFKLFGKSPSTGTITAYLKVPAILSNGVYIPDMRYAGKIKKGAKLKSKSGITCETIEDIDFSKIPNSTPGSEYVAVAETDSINKSIIKSFLLKYPSSQIKAGETKSTTFTIGAYRAFNKITLQDADVIEIISIVDSEGNTWYEVDFLAQDAVFDGVLNVGSDSTDVPYVMKLRSVPYRFITDYDPVTKRLSCVFGSGDAETFNGDLIPDLGLLSLPLYGKDTFTDFSLDPQNFLKTNTLGYAPVNTTFTVKYRVGGGFNSNLGSGEVNSVGDKTFEVGDSTLPTATVRDVGNSFSVINNAPIAGGRDELTIDELKQIIPLVYSSQSRLVTIQDFIARTLSMPAKFGSVFRVNAKSNPINTNQVDLFILALDYLGNIIEAPPQLKLNLKTYLSRFRMITDAIVIYDAEVINLAVDFEILTNPEFNKTEVIANCIDSLKDHFKITNWQLNQPINITSIYTLLASVPGVLSVINLNFVNRSVTYDNRSYSQKIYNIKENTINGIIYCEENSIFEIKYPGKDITGVAR